MEEWAVNLRAELSYRTRKNTIFHMFSPFASGLLIQEVTNHAARGNVRKMWNSWGKNVPLSYE